jgi:hypothetical protein
LSLEEEVELITKEEVQVREVSVHLFLEEHN